MQEFGEESVWNGNHRVEMLLRNEVEGVLPIRRETEGGKGGLVYDTAGFLSLEDWCRTKVLGERELRWVLEGVLDTLENGASYLLSPGCFFVDPEHLFVKPAKEEVKLCVRPEGQGNWNADLCELGRFLLEAIDYKDEESVKLAYEFYHVSKREQVKPEDCRKLLQARVYTIITDDGEQTDRFLPLEVTQTEVIEIGSATSWIHIEAREEELNRMELREARRKEEKKKRLFRVVISVIAVSIILVLLWQSGF
ncbi:MAG: hypothetical protein IKU83_03910 [Lachnospiraceae bacterium]|nr:hypothetical protein [Lachnospiraceae bacterium]